MADGGFVGISDCGWRIADGGFVRIADFLGFRIADFLGFRIADGEFRICSVSVNYGLLVS
jgi:hypothetical protein